MAEDLGVEIDGDSADERGGGEGGVSARRNRRRGCLNRLRWPEEWLSPKSFSGRRLSTSFELRDAMHRTFTSALKDARLLPSDNGGWAKPLRVQDALIPSASEAADARAAGTAPEPSALEGPALVLSLNWLALCCRAGQGEEKRARQAALACCRRFQLSRPDHPALLAHNLLEHHMTAARRSLDDVYREISCAFDRNGGAAAAAALERGEDIPREDDEGGVGDVDALSPTGGRLEAVYAFLRFVGAREDELGAGSDNHAAVAAVVPPATLSLSTGDDMKNLVAASGATTTTTRERDNNRIEATRTVLRNSLIHLWIKPNPALDYTRPGRSDSMMAADRWLRGSDGQPLIRAVEGAKASLVRWADGAGSGSTAGKKEDTSESGVPASDDGLGAERQLSTIFFALWVLGGASTAIGALDHLLRAESFSTMPPERRRLAWLQRLEATIVLSDQQQVS